MSEAIVRMEGIRKAFPGVQALDDVSFELRAGEVMALLGENGAGKSTLMKILSGVYQRDEGRIELFGHAVGELSPHTAERLGVAIIHQELNLCPHLTVAENMFLGRELASHGGLLDDKAMRRQAKMRLDDLRVDIDVDLPVGRLPVSKQQMVEIARALSLDARILIMDEPTSALTSREIDDLFVIIRRLRSEGRGIVYISHRFEELKHIVDRVTIMRDGRLIAVDEFSALSLERITSLMVGRELSDQFPRIESRPGREIFRVEGLNAGPLVRDVGFSVWSGEIVGIAGLMGAGRTETTRAIFGVDRRESGRFFLDGRPVELAHPASSIAEGLVLVPEDRKKDGLCVKLSIRENLALPNLDWLCGGLGVVSRAKERRMVEEARKGLSVRMAHAEAQAATLSGGNQQKLVVGKWLARPSRLVIFDEPTRGIDVGAKVEIYRLMNELKEKGVGVVFVSSELPEVLGMADRILVMCDGRITGELMAAEATQEMILELATRFENKLTAEGRAPAMAAGRDTHGND